MGFNWRLDETKETYWQILATLAWDIRWYPKDPNERIRCMREIIKMLDGYHYDVEDPEKYIKRGGDWHVEWIGPILTWVHIRDMDRSVLNKYIRFYSSPREVLGDYDTYYGGGWEFLDLK